MRRAVRAAEDEALPLALHPILPPQETLLVRSGVGAEEARAARRAHSDGRQLPRAAAARQAQDAPLGVGGRRAREEGPGGGRLGRRRGAREALARRRGQAGVRQVEARVSGGGGGHGCRTSGKLSDWLGAGTGDGKRWEYRQGRARTSCPGCAAFRRLHFYY